jgi:hypothetical protein
MFAVLLFLEHWNPALASQVGLVELKFSPQVPCGDGPNNACIYGQMNK